MSRAATMAEELAEFAAGYSYEDLSYEIVEKSKVSILDQVGCQLLGSTLPWVQAPYLMVKDLGGFEEATVVNHGFRTSAYNAGFTNAVYGHSAELDDYGAGIGSHSGSVCLATGLALGEALGKSGQELIAALNLGYDTSWILGEIMHKDLLSRGMHGHAVQTVFAAASVAGRLFGLTAEQQAQAYAVAGSYASGTMEFYRSGGEVKRLHSGKSVRAGIESALLAMHGMTGPLTIFEGEWGILALLANIKRPQARSLNLRTAVGMGNNCFKFFPTNAVQQSPIRILGSLLEASRATPQEVERVEVRLDAGAIRDSASFDPPTGVVGAQLSIPFSLSLTIARGSNDLALYVDSKVWNADDVRDASKKIHLMVKDDAKGKYDCEVRVTLADGRVLEDGSLYPWGSHWNPATPEEVTAKFKRLTGGIFGEGQLDQIIASCASIDRLPDVSDFAQLLVNENAGQNTSP